MRGDPDLQFDGVRLQFDDLSLQDLERRAGRGEFVGDLPGAVVGLRGQGELMLAGEGEREVDVVGGRFGFVLAVGAIFLAQAVYARDGLLEQAYRLREFLALQIKHAEVVIYAGKFLRGTGLAGRRRGGETGRAALMAVSWARKSVSVPEYFWLATTEPPSDVNVLAK